MARTCLADHRLPVSWIRSDLVALCSEDIKGHTVFLHPSDDLRLGGGDSADRGQMDASVLVTHGEGSACETQSEHSSAKRLIASRQTCFQLEGAASFFFAHGWDRADDELIRHSSSG